MNMYSKKTLARKKFKNIKNLKSEKEKNKKWNNKIKNYDYQKLVQIVWKIQSKMTLYYRKIKYSQNLQYSYLFLKVGLL